MAAEHPYAADNDSQEDMIINPLGVAASDDLSIEEKLDKLVAMKQAVGQRGSDGTLDPGLVARQMQDIDAAMARVQSQSDPVDGSKEGGRRPES
ncbi:hypothetical protein [Notoacmeibacter sp. MSK16QG-6]|uniref:hypothetical protein n=1 Tax=Notoacmeibacter sp. MSK16QG-6 TaxID=2957982 RepID=UPI00209CBFD2|nr:hypothetical protein [Notoacmeibacter sp. MSK16QG-6]MCP1198954.1 hypothetical protein [Notoacmeibacter sp. MSK16QG-6]